MNNKTLYIVSGIVGGILITVLLSSIVGRTSYGGMMSWGSNRIDSGAATQIVTSNSIDQHFIEQMIPHHNGAIAMATVALKKSTHPEIKTLAQAIIKSQTQETQDMQGWYINWFGQNVPTTSTSFTGGGMMSGSGMHMGGEQDIVALENAPDFDKTFIEQMIPHHQLAIMMAQMLSAGTNRPEMQQLAKNIITSQSQEIQQMQAWYKEWYK